jgi:hydroxymethylpyrimidine/phosphomethylpyrimidine kinase
VDELFPLADLITPNIYEAEVLNGESIQNIQNMERAAHKLLSLGPRAVLLKGGHLTDRCDDLLMTSSSIKVFPGVRIASIHTHGTGCSLSSAITALWAREIPLEQAVAEAKAWLTEAIIEGIPLGKGHGPVHHFHAFYDREGLPRQKRQ